MNILFSLILAFIRFGIKAAFFVNKIGHTFRGLVRMPNFA
ncbi:hypothetical protein GCM10008967_20760 [Bacillus carboniphilus]|uniref:Uncharacterized protein n=1 Tax=Bacillus carboniphilus TaxID=86663 RepID=A0ABP3G104_9BACI